MSITDTEMRQSMDDYQVHSAYRRLGEVVSERTKLLALAKAAKDRRAARQRWKNDLLAVDFVALNRAERAEDAALDALEP